jgi:hypothetical protein
MRRSKKEDLLYWREYYRKNKCYILERSKKRYRKIANKKRKQSLEYYYNNREAMLANWHRRFAEDPEKYLSKNRKYYNKNKKAINAKHRRDYRKKVISDK